ncbi:putative ornithine aminotransferase, mitochondrial [Trichinella nativa]|uniref:Ornithine aminotransferase n=1 Tax=Trichinella nativa TaxID=6335 RepID=A0A0V1KLZ1_9BILA|nr:putative ornithine aminotransferase, mitochondrial [Trichinella nativa]
MTNLFGYDKLLPMNSGVESCESGLKLAQRWAYDVKQILGKIISRGLIKHTLGIYPYNDPGALEQIVLSTNGSNVAAFMVEPIQGEAGIKVAKDGGYSRKVAEICQRYNVLLIVDDVQTGLGRIGKRLCSDSENVRPDFLIFGKALLGGCYLILALLCYDPIMLNIKPDQQSTTFGCNALAC